jgi:uncharacterized protein
MAKVPRPGAVKTRLVPPLTPAEAAELGGRLLQDTLDSVVRAAAVTAARPFLVYTPEKAVADLRPLVPAGVELLPQRGLTLTERLQGAAGDIEALGCQAICLMDADSPTLPDGLLTQAIAALQAGGRDDILIIPADDGGYCVIGLSAPCPELFAGIEWSTPQVLEQTLRAARAAGRPVRLLPPWYDVDNLAGLARLHAELFDAPADGRAPHTRALLTELVRRHPELALASRG